MCGIVGIISNDAVNNDLYNALLSLQHRGQDSAGIATVDKTRLNLKKGLGLIENVFTEENLSLLNGNYGIAHVRYSTAGATPKKEVQPFLVGYPNLIAIAHNGNILNTTNLKEKFKDRTESESDSELVLHLLCSKLTDKELSDDNIFNAVKECMTELNGSYSIVCAIAGVGLLAFRDPQGIRPLVMGKSKNGVMFASETVAIDAINYEYVKDLDCGEAIIVRENLKISERILLKRESKHCMFEWIYFARPDSEIEGKSVYVARIKLGKLLAKQILDKKLDPDVIVPVPDTSKPSALGLSEETGILTEEGLIKNRYIGRTFIMPTQSKRDKALFVKLNPNKVVLENKKIILIDDSIVRGTTSRRIVNVAKKYANKIYFVSACAPIKYPCYYGVDFPLAEELIANQKTIEEIRKEINADELIYATIEDIKDCIRIKGLCTACLDGIYPTDVSDLQKSISESRKKERTEINKNEK